MNPPLTLTLHDLIALDEALAATPELKDRAMNVCMLEGLFTSLAIGPRLVMPSVWMAWVWDVEQGERHPEFTSEAAFSAVLMPVMQFYNQTASAWLKAPEAFEPLFWQPVEHWHGEDWCFGFCLGLRLALDDWAPLLESQPDLVMPLMLQGDAELAEEYEALSDDGRDQLEDAIVPCLVSIAAHWRSQGDFGGAAPEPLRRAGPKLGRNDLCHCGSGRKYKKCHGAD